MPDAEHLQGGREDLSVERRVKQRFEEQQEPAVKEGFCLFCLGFQAEKPDYEKALRTHRVCSEWTESQSVAAQLAKERRMRKAGP